MIQLSSDLDPQSLSPRLALLEEKYSRSTNRQSLSVELLTVWHNPQEPTDRVTIERRGKEMGISGPRSWAHTVLWGFLEWRELFPKSVLEQLTFREWEAYWRVSNGHPAYPMELFPPLNSFWNELKVIFLTLEKRIQTGETYVFPESKSFWSLPLNVQLLEVERFFLSQRFAPFRTQGGHISLLNIHPESHPRVFELQLSRGNLPLSVLRDWVSLELMSTFRVSEIILKIHEK
jgi:hypothetical protein